MRYVLLTIGVLVLVGLSMVAMMAWMFGPGMCGHDRPETVMSPDNRYQALVFEGDCGAADHAHKQVSILRAGKALGRHELGNVFSVREDVAIAAIWTDSAHLRIDYPADAKIEMKKASYDSIQIEYMPVK